MIVTYILIFVFTVFLSIFGYYIFSAYIFPRKIEEIAQMIEMGKTRLAIKKLTELLEKDDRNPLAHFLLAEAYLKENNIQYAILEYRQVLKLGRFDEKVDEVVIRSKLAKIHLDRGDTEEAKKEFLILTKISPEKHENYYQLGVIYFNTGAVEKAGNYFKKSIQLYNKLDMAYYYLGQIQYKMNNLTDAKQSFIEAIKIEQANYRAHYFLGLVLRQTGDHEWAIKEFEIAQKSDDIKIKCFLAKGTCYLERDMHPKAIIEFERGLKFAKRGSDTELNLRYYLASSQESIRDLQGAIANWEQIAAVNKGFRDVQEKLKTYAEFRQDDRVKDFMIAGLSQFEHDSRKIVEAMGLSAMDVDIISDTEIEIVAADNEAKWRNARMSNKVVRIMRTTDSVQDKLLRKLHESMKQKNANRIIIISAGDYNQSAVEFANTRPIELLGKSDLVRLLKNIGN
jgi:tetratricopeptide (TPR) repeat protein